MNIKIEKGFEPTIQTGRGVGYTTTLKQMKKGDSFVVPTFENSNSVRSSANYLGFKIITRKQPDGTFRIWRKFEK